MQTVTPQEQQGVAITNFVDELVICMMNTRIYPSNHPRVSSATSEILRLLNAFATQHGRGSITLGAVEGCLVYDERPLVGASLSAKRLIDAITERGATAVQIDHGANENDIGALMTMLTTKDGEIVDVATANQKLASLGCNAARLLELSTQAGSSTGGEPADLAPVESGADGKARDLIKLPIQLYQDAVNLLQSLTISVCQGGTFGFEMAQGCIEGILEQLRVDAKQLLGIARCEQYDAYTFGHSIRVCLLALNFARHLTDNPQLLNRIGVAALLHDIGKSKIPFEILHCKTSLDPEQKRIMEQHPALGAEILLDNGGADPMSVAAAFGHHMIPGTGGYPKVQHQAELSLITKIVKICDVYEALTAARPYKDAMSPVRAFRIMLTMKQQFDFALLRRFIEVNGFYPTGSVVELSDGSRARVEKQNSRLDVPVVRVETTPTGHALCAGDQILVDLAQDESGRNGLKIQDLIGQAALPGVG